MSMLTTGEPIHPKRLLAVKPAVDRELEERLKRARAHATACLAGAKNA